MNSNYFVIVNIVLLRTCVDERIHFSVRDDGGAHHVVSLDVFHLEEAEVPHDLVELLVQVVDAREELTGVVVLKHTRTHVRNTKNS